MIGSIPVTAPADRPAGPAYQHQDKPNGQQHNSDGLQEADASQETDEKEDQSENNHGVSNLSRL